MYIFVSLLAWLRENGWTDLHEIFREGAEWPWDDLIQFLVNSEKPRNAAMLCQQHYKQTARPICMKFSGNVWSNHATTWLHFWPIPRNRVMHNTGTGLVVFSHHSLLQFLNGKCLYCKFNGVFFQNYLHTAKFIVWNKSVIVVHAAWIRVDNLLAIK